MTRPNEGYEAEGYDEGAMMTGGTGADPNKGKKYSNSNFIVTRPSKPFGCLVLRGQKFLHYRQTDIY